MKHFFKTFFGLGAVVTLLATSHQVLAQNGVFDNLILDGGSGSLDPFIRFERPGSGNRFIVGFSNNLAFYDGNSYSFQIYQDAPNALLNLNLNGVGIGTTTPDTLFHVTNANGNARIKVEETNGTRQLRSLFALQNNGPPAFSFQDTSSGGAIWNFRGSLSNRFSISEQNSGVVEVQIVPGGNMIIGGNLTESSSRSKKENIEQINHQVILDKVLSLPVSEWNYKHDHHSVKHIGPMAEDFYNTFELGATDKGISSIDTGGIALAAIQGLKNEKDKDIQILNNKLDEKDKELQILNNKLDEIDQRNLLMQRANDEKEEHIAYLEKQLTRLDALENVVKRALSNQSIALQQTEILQRIHY